MLADKTLKEPLPKDPKLSHIVSNNCKLLSQRLKKSSQILCIINLFNLNNKQSTNPVKLSLTVHGQSLVMEVVTEASLCLISEKTYLSVWTDSNRLPYQPQVLVYKPTPVKESQFFDPFKRKCNTIAVHNSSVWLLSRARSSLTW